MQPHVGHAALSARPGMNNLHKHPARPRPGLPLAAVRNSLVLVSIVLSIKQLCAAHLSLPCAVRVSMSCPVRLRPASWPHLYCAITGCYLPRGQQLSANHHLHQKQVKEVQRCSCFAGVWWPSTLSQLHALTCYPHPPCMPKLIDKTPRQWARRSRAVRMSALAQKPVRAIGAAAASRPQDFCTAAAAVARPLAQFCGVAVIAGHPPRRRPH